MEAKLVELAYTQLEVEYCPNNGRNIAFLTFLNLGPTKFCIALDKLYEAVASIYLL